MIEERRERALRGEPLACPQPLALRQHVVAGESAAAVAQEDDRPAEVEGQGRAEGVEADDGYAGLDVRGELPR